MYSQQTCLKHLVLVPMLAMLTLFMGCQGDTQPDTSKEPPERSAGVTAVATDSVPSADGVMIYYDVYGQGDTTVMLVHGWACDASYWKEQIDALNDEYRVVAIDLAGHGRSGVGRDEWTMSAYGADVAAVADDLNAGNIALVGHSMGGTVILEAAAMLGDRVHGVIGVDTYQNLGQTHTEEEVAGYIAYFEQGFEDKVKEFVRGMFPDNADSTLVNEVVNDMAKTPQDVGLGSFRYLFAYDNREVLSKLDIPILTIASDKYPIEIEQNKELYAGFDATIIDSTGHFLHMERPSEFNQRLVQTVRRIWLRPGETGRR